MATKGWRTEDWMAVFLGFLIIVVVLAFFNTKAVDLRNAVSTFRWTTHEQVAARAPGWIATLNGISKEAEAKGQKDVVALSAALKEALEKNDRKAVESAAGKMAKLGSRTMAGALAVEIRGHATAVAETRIFTWDNLSKVVYVGVIYLVLAAIGFALLGGFFLALRPEGQTLLDRIAGTVVGIGQPKTPLVYPAEEIDHPEPTNGFFRQAA